MTECAQNGVHGKICAFTVLPAPKLALWYEMWDKVDPYV